MKIDAACRWSGIYTGKSPTRQTLASVLGITSQAVYAWQKDVPPQHQLTLHRLSGGKLKISAYAREILKRRGEL